MTLRKTLLAALSGLCSAIAPQASQAACSLKTVLIPVTMVGTVPLATAKVNGAEVKFIIDSGAFYNTIDTRLAEARNLRPAPVTPFGSHVGRPVETAVTGVGGDVAAKIVLVDDFGFLGVSLGRTPFIAAGTFGSAAGLIGQNLLSMSDTEYDLGKGQMKLVWPTGCEKTEMVFWAPGQAYSVIPLLEHASVYNPHTVGPVTVNGVKLRAAFDTGANVSFITEDAARRAGVKLTDPGAQPAADAHGIGRRPVKTWTARFASVKIGDEEITNGLLTIGQTNDLVGFDMLVGADFFLSHHIYVANSQDKLYFTYGGGRVFNVPPKDNTEPLASPAPVPPNG